MNKNLETAIIFSRKLEQFPSLMEAFTVNQEGIEQAAGEIVLLEKELNKQGKKVELAEQLGLPLQPFRRRENQLEKQVTELKQAKEAYREGYLEIPNLGQATTLEYGDDTYWGFRLPGNVPIRVLEAIKVAKGKELFRSIVVYDKQRGRRDPIIAGLIGGRVFYITSYR